MEQGNVMLVKLETRLGRQKRVEGGCVLVMVLAPLKERKTVNQAKGSRKEDPNLKTRLGYICDCRVGSNTLN
jgi:hypothetical protein